MSRAPSMGAGIVPSAEGHTPAQWVAPRSESPRRDSAALKWPWKLARVFGFDVYVHATLLLLIAYSRSAASWSGKPGDEHALSDLIISCAA